MDKTDNNDVQNIIVSDLLSHYATILEELRHRGIVRSSNNPLSDYAELLFCKAFQWAREENSKAGYDATDNSGIRYQIKGRRLSKYNGSRQVSAIRGLDKAPFEYLAGLLVNENFQIFRAALVPISIVKARSVHVIHTNSWKFLLRDDVWDLPDVRDVTADLRAIALTI